MAHNGPVGAVQGAAVAHFKPDVLPAAGIADNQLPQARLKQPAARKLNLGRDFGHIGGDADEREINPDVGHAAPCLEGHHGLKGHDRLPLRVLPDSG